MIHDSVPAPQAGQHSRNVRERATALGVPNVILEDPNSKFSAAPEGTMRYAEFMSRVGTIKAEPASWKDYFATVPSGS